MRYRTIVADPPWETYAGPSHFQARKPTRRNGSSFDPRYTNRTRPLAYPMMTVKEMSAVPVSGLVADDAHLYLWTINARIEETYGLARAWGFRPSTLLTWCKKPRGIGHGGTFTLANEHVLFCRRGVLASKTRVDTNWWLWKRSATHSAKPEAFLDLVEQVSPGPYLELFARRQRLGWDTYGNEALEHVELVS